MEKNSAKPNISLLPGEWARFFIKDPLFMFLCPIKAKRAEFIEKYFRYYLEKWSREGALIDKGSKNIAAVLTNPEDFVYKFPGKNGLSLKMNRFSPNILNHMEVVQNIIDIVVPAQLNKRLLTIYAAPEVDEQSIDRIIDFCKQKAKEENFVLVYETFSKRFVKKFEEKGFETGYSRQFLNTQFFQTVMTYNI